MKKAILFFILMGSVGCSSLQEFIRNFEADKSPNAAKITLEGVGSTKTHVTRLCQKHNQGIIGVKNGDSITVKPNEPIYVGLYASRNNFRRYECSFNLTAVLSESSHHVLSVEWPFQIRITT